MNGFFSLAVLAICFFSVNAFSARWIVEDAKSNINSNISNFKLIKQFKVGDKSYSIVESLDVSQSAVQAQDEIFRATRAKSVLRDIPIQHRPAKPVSFNEASFTETNVGWHTQRLKYDQLNSNFQGQGITVAIIDTGVDIHHPQLASKIWTNPYEIPGNNVDDDSNGYIDDTHGWNFAENNNEPADDNGHGTHCAGIVAADPHSSSPSRGIAPYSKIMAVRLLGSQETRQIFMSDAIEAIVYAANNGARILSSSWGFYLQASEIALYAESLQLFTDAMSHVYYRGVVFINASGNESFDLDSLGQEYLNFPTSLPNVYNMIGIASSDHNGSRDIPSDFTNYGPSTVHFAAPGSNIMSTIPGGGWASFSGTSMATPLFAGALARVMSKGYTWIEATQILIQTVDAQAQPAWQGKIRFGQIDPEAALR